jgi:Holliday junction resolvase RusA-like endonuclease
LTSSGLFVDQVVAADQKVAAQVPIAKRPPDLAVYLPGAPRGKGRPRSRIAKSKTGNQFVAVYTDAETRNYEAMLRYGGQEAAKKAGFAGPLDCALRLRVTAVFAVPVSWSKRDKAAAIGGLIRHTSKPDCDNLVKTLDALNGVVWRDDSLIVEVVIRKFYGEVPGLHIEIWRFTGGLV